MAVVIGQVARHFKQILFTYILPGVTPNPALSGEHRDILSFVGHLSLQSVFGPSVAAHSTVWFLR